MKVMVRLPGEVANRRMRSSVSETTGLGLRCSCRTNATSETTPRTPRPMIAGEVQPHV